MDKFKFVFTDTKCIVNKEKRTITYIITGYINRKKLFILPESTLRKIEKRFNIYEDKFIRSQFTFSATTKCNSNDEWNEIKGKRIAESKCKAKIYKFMKNLSNAVMNYYVDMCNFYSNTTARYNYMYERENAHIVELDMNNYESKKASNS